MERPDIFVVGNSVSWRIILRDSDGTPLASTPTVAITLDGLAIPDVITVTAEGSGTYLVSVTIEDASEGDNYLVTESVIGYTNAWTLTALNEEYALTPTGSELLFTVTVQDNELTLLSGISVNVLSSAGTYTGVKGISDVVGVVELNLPPGNYKLQVPSSAGYDYYEPQPITVSQASTDTVILLQKVTPTTNTISRIRRVKTKHMEIESFNPKDIQAAEEREKDVGVSFCSLLFCKGSPK